MAEIEYTRKLNEWHIELAILEGAFEFLTSSFEDSKTCDLAHVLIARFHDLVESCPFPEMPAHE